MTLARAGPGSDSSAYRSRCVSGRPSDRRARLQRLNGSNMIAATRLRPSCWKSSPLTVAPSNKRVHHVALALDGSRLVHEPGDSLGLWPRNATRLVDETSRIDPA